MILILEDDSQSQNRSLHHIHSCQMQSAAPNQVCFNDADEDLWLKESPPQSKPAGKKRVRVMMANALAEVELNSPQHHNHHTVAFLPSPFTSGYFLPFCCVNLSFDCKTVALSVSSTVYPLACTLTAKLQATRRRFIPTSTSSGAKREA